MIRKIMCVAALCLMALPIMADDSAGAPVPVDKKVGYALLDGLGQTFHEMAVATSSKEENVKRIEEFLGKTMTEAKKARDQKQIDPIFFARYARLLAIIKLVLQPDPYGILGFIIDRELERFVWEVLGEKWKGSGPGAIGQVANAIADEIINLHLYLDNVETKEKLRKSWDEKISDVDLKKKESAPQPDADAAVSSRTTPTPKSSSSPIPERMSFSKRPSI
jgi:hypothetical protein